MLTKEQGRALGQEGQAGGGSAIQDSPGDLPGGLRHQVRHDNLGLAGGYQPPVALQAPHPPWKSTLSQSPPSSKSPLPRCPQLLDALRKQGMEAGQHTQPVTPFLVNSA